MKDYNVGDEIEFSYAGATMVGKIYKLDSEKGYYWTRAENHNFPLNKSKIIKKV